MYWSYSYNCVFISCCPFSSTSKGFKIIVAHMGGQGAPNCHVFAPLILAYMSLNVHVSVTTHIVILQIHWYYMKLSCHCMHKCLHFCAVNILVHPLPTINHAYDDYTIVEIKHDKKSLCTRWSMLTIQYTFDEFLNIIIEISANCCWVTCN